MQRLGKAELIGRASRIQVIEQQGVVPQRLPHIATQAPHQVVNARYAGLEEQLPAGPHALRISHLRPDAEPVWQWQLMREADVAVAEKEL